MKKLVRVNLGSGSDYKEGWINVDVQSAFRTDIIADLSEPFPFADNSVDELLASDILEHFTKEDGERFLQECHRVLKSGGKITLRTHNVAQIIKQFKFDPRVMIHFLYGDTKETGVFGSHKFGYTKITLTKTLKRIGFHIDSFKEETTNFLVIAKKIAPPKKKMNISIIQQAPDIGGAELYMVRLAQELVKMGNTISFTSNYEPLIKMFSDMNCETHHVPFRLDIIGNIKGLIKSILLLPSALYFYTKLLYLLKKQHTDVILMSGFSEKMLVTFLSIFFQIPTVWIEYGSLRTIFPRNFYLPKVLYRLLNPFPVSVIVPSMYTLRNLTTEGHVSLAKLVLLPCGVAIPKRNGNKNEKEFVVGNASRLAREKGQEYLIESITYINKKIPNIKLIMTGTGPDKEYFERLVKKFHVEKYVKLPGFVPDINQYYDEMDVFVFPTVWDLEGFGLVLPEAMAHGLPVVASRLGPVPEIVQDGRTGILVLPRNARAIADAIFVLWKDKQLSTKMGKVGYSRAKEMYDLKKIANDMRDILFDAKL